MRAGRIGSAVAAHKGAPRFRQRQALRRKLGEELPRGSVGEALARGLLDSDCESCSGRRRTSHITAAVRATDYVRKVRAALAAKKAATAAAAAVILTEDEEDGEEVWIEEDEDSDPGHVPLGKKGPDDPPDGAGGLEGRVGTAFSQPPDGGCARQWSIAQRTALRGVRKVVGARKGHEAGSCAGAQEVYNGKWRIPGELWGDQAFDDRARARRKGHEVQVQLPRCSREKVLAVHSQGDGQGKLLGLRQAKGKLVHARWGHRGVSREGKPEGYL